MIGGAINFAAAFHERFQLIGGSNQVGSGNTQSVRGKWQV